MEASGSSSWTDYADFRSALASPTLYPNPLYPLVPEVPELLALLGPDYVANNDLAPFRVAKLLWGFPKNKGTILGVPIIRTIVHWGLYWGPFILGNDHVISENCEETFWGSVFRVEALG